MELATSLRVDDDLTAESLKATDEFSEGKMMLLSR